MSMWEFTILFCFFFFFQAEDGIRDGHVTGVQTCALPICPVRRCGRRRTARRPVSSPLEDLGQEAGVLLPEGRLVLAGDRSEERRVGKECRSRWGADQ